MNQLQMAHEYFMKHGRNNSWMESDVIDAWKYADAMQAEADKREVSIEEAMKDHVHDYIYGRVCACGKVKDVEEEWQPDWSQAPDWANWWCLSVMHGAMWFSREPICTKATWVMLNDVKFCAASFDEAPPFNYQGNWQDSLWKRPQ